MKGARAFDSLGRAPCKKIPSAGCLFLPGCGFTVFAGEGAGSKDPEKCHSNILMGRLHNIFEQDHGSVSGTAPLASFECVFNGAQNDTR